MAFTLTIIHSSFLTKAREKNKKTLHKMIPATMRTNLLWCNAIKMRSGKRQQPENSDVHKLLWLAGDQRRKGARMKETWTWGLNLAARWRNERNDMGTGKRGKSIKTHKRKKVWDTDIKDREKRGNNEFNMGKLANTSEGMKSATAAVRQPQCEIREEAREEEVKEMGKGSAE